MLYNRPITLLMKEIRCYYRLAAQALIYSKTMKIGANNLCKQYEPYKL